MRDLANNIAVVSVIAPQSIGDSLTSEAIDVRDFGSLTIAISTGDVDSPYGVNVTFWGSDVLDAEFAAPLDPEPTGKYVELRPKLELPANSTVHIGNGTHHRYIKVRVSGSGNVSVVAIKGRPRVRPIVQPTLA
ncbi:hypothetical protein ACFFTN_27595 [Aminobacter aganoensis]|uniref:Uncharacterized protein n=1 Tax=Aminobacter aganoensis TaxID=83264 RepID=A0A7X0KNY4_9HYPH|nr:hypothetical protein [Aminobacter aganoensis]MBB6357660.1 hypothetical protein [Aminobacter aganoensis]